MTILLPQTDIDPKFYQFVDAINWRTWNTQGFVRENASDHDCRNLEVRKGDWGLMGSNVGKRAGLHSYRRYCYQSTTAALPPIATFGVKAIIDPLWRCKRKPVSVAKSDHVLGKLVTVPLSWCNDTLMLVRFLVMRSICRRGRTANDVENASAVVASSAMTETDL